MFSSASLVSALRQSVMDLLLCILLERACSADRLSLRKVICWSLKVISSSAACLMAAFRPGRLYSSLSFLRSAL